MYKCTAAIYLSLRMLGLYKWFEKALNFVEYEFDKIIRILQSTGRRQQHKIRYKFDWALVGKYFQQLCPILIIIIY